LFRLPEILIEVLPVHPELIHQNPVDKETGVCGGGGEKRRGRDWEVGEVNNSMLHHRQWGCSLGSLEKPVRL